MTPARIRGKPYHPVHKRGGQGRRDPAGDGVEQHVGQWWESTGRERGAEQLKSHGQRTANGGKHQK